MTLNESTVEDAALTWFGDLGYDIAHGPDLAPGEPASERDGFGDVVLVGRLREAIQRLNPDLPDEAWEEAFAAWEGQIAGYAPFLGKLGEDAEALAACLKFDEEFDRAGERLGTYAHLKTAEDTGESAYQRMQGRYINVAGRAAEAASYIRPEILAIPDARMQEFLASEALAPYRLLLERLLRYPQMLPPRARSSTNGPATLHI